MYQLFTKATIFISEDRSVEVLVSLYAYEAAKQQKDMAKFVEQFDSEENAIEWLKENGEKTREYFILRTHAV